MPEAVCPHFCCTYTLWNTYQSQTGTKIDWHSQGNRGILLPEYQIRRKLTDKHGQHSLVLLDYCRIKLQEVSETLCPLGNYPELA